MRFPCRLFHVSRSVVCFPPSVIFVERCRSGAPIDEWLRTLCAAHLPVPSSLSSPVLLYTSVTAINPNRPCRHHMGLARPASFPAGHSTRERQCPQPFLRLRRETAANATTDAIHHTRLHRKAHVYFYVVGLLQCRCNGTRGGGGGGERTRPNKKRKQRHTDTTPQGQAARESTPTRRRRQLSPVEQAMRMLSPPPSNQRGTWWPTPESSVTDRGDQRHRRRTWSR